MWAVPGFTSARHFAADVDREKRYLALYELQTDDPAAALAEPEARVDTEPMPILPAPAPSAQTDLYEAIGSSRGPSYCDTGPNTQMLNFIYCEDIAYPCATRLAIRRAFTAYVSLTITETMEWK